MLRSTLLIALLLLPAPTSAAEVTATLALKNMFCAACSLTVREAIAKVPGVKDVTVDYDKKVATVVYDDTIATVERLAAASRNAGFPAERKE